MSANCVGEQWCGCAICEDAAGVATLRAQLAETRDSYGKLSDLQVATLQQLVRVSDQLAAAERVVEAAKEHDGGHKTGRVLADAVRAYDAAKGGER